MRAARLALYFVVGLLLGGVSVLSYAETQPATYGAITSPIQFATQYDASGVCHASAGAACAARNMDVVGGGDYPACGKNNSPSFDTGPCCPAGAWKVTIGGKYSCSSGSGYSCPKDGGWTLSGQTCSRPDCAPGETRDPSSGTCKPPPCPASGSVIGTASSKYGGSGSSNGGLICISQCQVQASACAGNGSSYGCVGPFVATGQNCTSQSAPSPISPNDPRTTCIESGQAYGTVNGVVVCTPATSTNSTSTTTQTTTSSSSPSNPSTSQTNSHTQCEDGNCTTTTTQTDPSTGVGTTTTTTQGKGDFCAQNPKSPNCSGTSDQADYCAENPSSLGCLKSGTPTEGGKLEEKTIGVSSITPVTLASNNSCPAPLTLPRGWGSIDLKPACDLADLIRPLVLICAWLSAGLIVLGAFKSE